MKSKGERNGSIIIMSQFQIYVTYQRCHSIHNFEYPLVGLILMNRQNFLSLDFH